MCAVQILTDEPHAKRGRSTYLLNAVLLNAVLLNAVLLNAVLLADLGRCFSWFLHVVSAQLGPQERLAGNVTLSSAKQYILFVHS